MSMFLVLTVVVMMIIVVGISSTSSKAKIREQEKVMEQLSRQIEAEEKRSETIEEFRIFTQTKKYIEEVAKEKLGLVYEGEIIFKEED